MNSPLESPLGVILLGVVVLVAIATSLVWKWAIRQPAPRPPGGSSQMLAAHSTELSPTGGEVVFAAVGASDVVGVGCDNPDKDNWPTVLHGLMPTSTRLLRFARSGILLREANALEIPAACRVSPTLVTLWNCVNDMSTGVALPAYERELELALGRLTRETSARLLVLNVPDMAHLLPPGTPERQRDLVRRGVGQWNRLIRRVVDKYAPRATILDLFAVSEEMMARREYVAADGFHLSTAGHRALAHMAWDVIKNGGLLERRS